MNNNSPYPILFISHDATRTGAPILLLRLIELLKQAGKVNPLVLLKSGGELQYAFATVATTFIWDQSCYVQNGKKSTGKRIADRLKREAKLLQAAEKKSFLKKVQEVNLVFNNTVTNSDLLRVLPIQGKRIYHYFHEMQVICDMSVTPAELLYQESIAEKILVPAKAVQEFYVQRFGLAENKFALLRYIVPAVKEYKENTIGLQGNKFIAGFSGSLNWRKGYELIPLLLKEIVTSRHVTDIEFVWLGANQGTLEYSIIYHDLLKLKLEHYLRLIPIQEDISPLLSELDIFVLPSKEDAFPLVVLEAAAAGKPCVYFKDAGGIGEFVKDDAGIPVNYLDVNSMADAILLVKNDRAKLAAMGTVAKQRVAGYTNAAAIADDFLKLTGLAS